MKPFLMVPVLLAIEVFAIRPAGAAPRPLRLASDGRAKFVIAVAADAIPAEKTAADELKKYLELVTGARFSEVSETEIPADAPQILVGAGPRARGLVGDATWKAVGADGIVIKASGQALVLAGARPRGSLYAVYEFLEREAGCRWWTPLDSTIPHRDVLEVKSPDLLYTPAFSYREYFAAAVREDPTFATKMRENGSFQTQDAAWGGHEKILGWCHTFSQLLPPATYFKTHPEWYSDPANGYRPCTAQSPQPAPGETQICLTNEAARDELAKQALLWIAKDPGAGYISITQNDNDAGFCTCPNCRRIRDAEASYSGPLLQFVNGVAQIIGREYPRITVETLAYLQTEKAPRTVRPAKNVVVRFAAINRDFGHPLESGWNQEAFQNLRDWSEISGRLMVWNYVTNFQNYCLPQPNWFGLGTDLRSFAAHKATGVYEQGDPYSKQGGDYAQMREWVVGRLLWNPALDQARLTDEFLCGYYGAAAPFVKQDLELVQRAYLEQKRPLGQTNQDYSFLSLDVMNKRTQLFEEAEKAVAGQDELVKRVQRLELSLQLCWLTRYEKLQEEALRDKKPFLGPADAKLVLDSFAATAATLGEPGFGPTGAFHYVLPKLQASLAAQASLPDFAKGFDTKDVIDFQEGRMYLYRKNELSFVVSDVAASDVKAASVRGDTEAWAAQVWLSEVLDGTTSGRWHVYAMARAIPRDKANLDGVGMRTGVYDGGGKKALTEFNVPLVQLAKEEYVPVDLGVQTLNSNSYVWFAPQRNPAVAEIRVDRVIFLKVKAPE